MLKARLFCFIMRLIKQQKYQINKLGQQLGLMKAECELESNNFRDEKSPKRARAEGRV